MINLNAERNLTQITAANLQNICVSGPAVVILPFNCGYKYLCSQANKKQ